MYKYSKILFFIFIFNLLIHNINNVAVCDLATLKMELLQDIMDNGMLDCQRKPGQPVVINESEEQKNKRIAAQWDSKCSFESSQDWKSELQRYYGIDHLIDVVGDPYEFNSEDQVDMCEIVRTIIHKNHPGINMYNLNPELISEIDCAGTSSQDFANDDRTKICAATGGSFFDPKGWTIFLRPSSITISDIQNRNKKFPVFYKDLSQTDNGTPKGNIGEAKNKFLS